MNKISRRRRVLLGPSGEPVLYEPRTGCFYTNPLDITISGTDESTRELQRRFSKCSYLVDATLRGYALGSAVSQDAFSSCPRLERLRITNGCSEVSFIARECPLLKEVTIGSVGYPVSALYRTAFSGSGNLASGKRITVYVADSTQIPLADAPWGLTDAAVIYRSATTGEIREVPTQ